MTLQVKLFTNIKEDSLEKDVNNWLIENPKITIENKEFVMAPVTMARKPFAEIPAWEPIKAICIWYTT